ncbi:MAG: response regulator [Anaerolineae bacterium]|nr:response regulator [Anaerolineae bacterium]
MTNPVILLIEDDSSLSQGIAEVIEFETAYIPEIIQDGRAAIERLQGQAADMVLLDLHLPNVSGLEILAQMRADPRWKQTRIVVMTADVMRAKEAEAQADLVMLKPVRIDDIISLFSRLMQSNE